MSRVCVTAPSAEVDSKVDDPPIGGPEGDSFDHPRLWQSWDTGEWQTDFPPPPGFDGPQQGEWDEEGYWRSLTDDELAALVSAGIAESGECVVTIEEDEAERDSFFAGLREGNGNQETDHPACKSGWWRGRASVELSARPPSTSFGDPPSPVPGREGRRPTAPPPESAKQGTFLANRLFGARGLCIGSSHMTPTLAFALSFTASAALIAGTAIAAEGSKLQTNLTGATEVPGPGDADGAGTASITVNSGKNQVCFALSVTGIDPATAAHVHVGAVGVAGPVAVGLSPPTNGTSSGCVTVAGSLAQAILKDPAAYYVNVHNAAFPAGAVRGQLAK